MFTGLVEQRGAVEKIERLAKGNSAAGIRLTVGAPPIAKDARIGDSIAISGCCLTVVKKTRSSLTFEAGSETLSRTTFSRLAAGDEVNLERSLQLGDRLGGHLVTGHVDGLATVIKRRDEGPWSHVTFRAPPRLVRQMAEKGSVAVDGVSLTVVSVTHDRFSVALIPHTLENTTLGELQIGSVCNIETDLVAKYVQRLLETRSADDGQGVLPALAPK
jgi:riboflavin synthase